jgi:nitrous oxide reductase accessory protein NosL
MLRKFLFTSLALFFLSAPGFNTAIAENVTPTCMQLDEKASGDMVKYSLHGEVTVPIFFSDIRCAVRYRNEELCAIEMISFDTTSKVYDFYTVEEIDISKAYFWLDEKNNGAPIVAFGSKEGAEKYGDKTGGGVILDYTGLADRKLE